MSDEINQETSNTQETAPIQNHNVNEQPKRVPKYTDDEVNGIVARVKREERERLQRQQAAPQESVPNVDIEKIVDERVNARIEKAQRAAFESSISSRLLGKFPEGEKKYEDFHEVVNAFKPQDDLALLNEVSGLENSVDVLYALGKTPTRADSFNRGLMSDNPARRAQTAKELAEYAKKIADKAKNSKELSEPPAPASRLKNSANVNTKNDNGGDRTEFYKNKARNWF